MPKRLSPRFLITLIVLIVVGLCGVAWLASDQMKAMFSGAKPTAAPAAPTSTTAPGSTAAPGPTTPPVAIIPPEGGVAQSLQFPVGSAQLAMIETQVIPSSPLPLTDSLSARVVYDEDVTARIGVGVAGRVVSIRAAPGDAVKIGQVLAEIDSPDFGTAYSDLTKARAEEDRRLQVLNRARSLGAGEAIAARDVEAAQTDYAQAQAETIRADQRLKTLNPYGHPIRDQRVWLSSPVAGIVAERTATPALEVVPGMTVPLFILTDPTRLWLLIDLPERLVGKVKVGDEVAVESDAFPSERFVAKIVQLGQAVDPNTRRVVVRARIKNPDRKLLPEMFVRASILQGVGTAVRIPNGALINRGVYAFVFIETTPGAFVRRPVKLQGQGSDFSYVGSGLEGGERIVVTGALLLDAELTARAGSKP
jgi:cobalt-zinc-cadmium efflux system membrane fusion protein